MKNIYITDDENFYENIKKKLNKKKSSIFFIKMMIL